MVSAKQIREDHGALTEDLSMRRRFAKHFFLEGDKKKAIISYAPLHFQARGTGEWTEIDSNLEIKNGKVKVKSAPYQIDLHENTIGVTFTTESNEVVTVELKKLGKKNVENLSLNLSPFLDGPKVTWVDVQPGLDIELAARGESIEYFKILKNATAEVEFEWEFTQPANGVATISKNTYGWDSGQNGTRKMKRLVDIERKEKETIKDGIKTTVITEKFKKRVQVKDRVTRQKSWSTDVVYPVTIDSSTSVDIGNNDDIGTGYANFWHNPGDFWGTYGSDICLRFRSVGVSQGASITTAEIKVRAKATDGGPTGQVEMDNVDDAPVWSNNSIPSKFVSPKVGAALSPNHGSPTSYTVGVTTIFESVVGRAGFSSGNDVRFGFVNTGGSGYQTLSTAVTYSSSKPNKQPTLSVVYTAGSGPGPSSTPARTLTGAGE